MPQIQSRGLVALAAVFWLVALAAGWRAVTAYNTAPGPVAKAPQYWPEATDLTRDVSRPTLVVFAHPRCPCTRATLGELDRIAARCQDKLKIVVSILSDPALADAGAEDVEGGLWQQAMAIPKVVVHADVVGQTSRWFGALTSGQTMLFAPDGHLVFAGGITAARGHAGDNAGADSIVQFVLHGEVQTSKTPVFGCSLARPELSKAE